MIKFTSESPDQTFIVDEAKKISFGNVNFRIGYETGTIGGINVIFKYPKLDADGKFCFDTNGEKIYDGGSSECLVLAEYIQPEHNPKMKVIPINKYIDIPVECDKIVVSIDIKTFFDLSVSISLN